jgi:MinD superfamily P-loop ATPase
VDAFCASAGLPVLLRIPFERTIAEGVAQGRTLVDIHPEYAPQLRTMVEQIRASITQG